MDKNNSKVRDLNLGDNNFRISDVFYDYIKEHRLLVGSYLILMLGSPINEVILPHFYGKLISSISSGKNISSDVYTILGLWLTARTLFTGAEYLDSKIIPSFSNYIETQIIENIFTRFSKTTEEVDISSLVYILSSLQPILGELFHSATTVFIPSVFVLVSSLIYFFTINKELGSVALIGITIMSGVLYYLADTCVEGSIQYTDAKTKSLSQIEDVLRNLINVYSNDSANKEFKNIVEESLKTQSLEEGLYVCDAKLKLVYNMAYVLLFLIINSSAYNLFKTKKIDIEQLSSTFIIVLYLIPQFNSVSMHLPVFMRETTLLTRIQTTINNFGKADVDALSRTNEIRNFSGNIQFKDLVIGYPTGISVGPLNIGVHKGNSLAIIGKSGTGKTTLINTILGFINPLGGDILFDGVSSKNIDPKIIRKNIGYIPQRIRLFNRSIYDNITYGLPKKPSKNEINRLIVELDLESILNSDLDRNVGTDGSKLSGGQKQILFLIKSILNDKPILILDEPTAAVDPVTKNKIIDILEVLKKKKVIICITHDPAIWNSFDRVFNLSNIKNTSF